MTPRLSPKSLPLTFAAALAGFAAGPACAEPLGYTLEGGVYAFGQLASDGATDLVPNPAARGYRGASLGADLVLRPKVTAGPLRFEGSFRLRDRSGADVTARTDEAFVEWAISDTVFVSLGRRNLSFGQSYCINPADLFRQPLQETRLFPTAVSRAMAGGVDMLTLDVLFNSGSSAKFVYAPEDPADASTPFAMAQFSGMLADGALDYTLSGFSGARPGVSLSLTRGIGDATVLYADASLRQGRDRQVVSGLAAGNILQFAAQNTGRFYPKVTVGLGHTLTNGLSFNLELTHDANGLSDSEWAQAMGALGSLTPVQSAAAGAALGQLNGALGQYTQRQNYGFMRMAKDSLWGSPVSLEMTVLHGFDDGSGSLGLRLERPVGERGQIGLMATHGYGGARGEFTQRPAQNTLSLYTTMSF